MSIPFPVAAWHVYLTPECDYYNSPLGDEFDRYNMGIHEIEFPELYVSGDFDGKKLKKDPRVVRVEAVWVICPYDFTRPHEEIDGLEIHSYFGKRLGGQWVGNCLGQARVYRKRAEALADLAKCDQGVGWVWSVARSRKSAGRQLASLVLEGDVDKLPALADTLEAEGHALAGKVRELCSPPQKRGRRGKRRNA